MKLPDGTSAEVTDLKNESGIITVTFTMTRPDGTTCTSWVSWESLERINCGPFAKTGKATDTPAPKP